MFYALTHFHPTACCLDRIPSEKTFAGHAHVTAGKQYGPDVASVGTRSCHKSTALHLQQIK